MDDAVSTSATESRALTGLRGAGALLVLLHHFALAAVPPEGVQSLNGLLLKGYLGVDLFFVLSGFVMAMVYGDWFPGPAAGRLRRTVLFLLRRGARLWPLQAAVLAAVLALEFRAGSEPSSRMVLANILMVQAWGISGGINPPAWSVSTELVAYGLFPLLAGPVLRGRAGIWLGFAGVAALLLTAMAFAPEIGVARRGQLDIYGNYSLLPLLRCLAGFTLGLLAWRLGGVSAIGRGAAHAATGPVALALMAALMLLRAHDGLIYPLLPVIVLGFHHGHGRLWRMFAAGPLYQAGVLSYAIYLVHYTLLRWLPPGARPVWATLPLFLLATVGIAALAHLAIELPLRRIIRGVGLAVLPPLNRPMPAPPLQPGPG